ncbi:phage head closure protein [Lactobacillus rhamnosus]|uniref:Phage head closure protein n=1 Tax=Lacticaseibacillus rhamnosus TaxID=47715 RepID=A0A7Y7QIK0_LACRH|nr:phage head closure protein [Lacticaseibacillus rhamnosus]NVO88948.1 phage head closure protein [Lacticaseibacillus rhamnosus]
MMVQLANPIRLDKLLSFGSSTSKVNQNGVPIEDFKAMFFAWGGAWQLSSTQLLTLAGTNQAHIQVYVVRHREDWSGVQKCQFAGKTYQVTGIAQDSANTPTSYDLVTVEEVVKNGR